jgi:membrane-associated protein
MHPFLDPASLPDLIASWGYLGIFVCIFLGNVGLPVPEETVLLAAGFFAGRELLSLEAVWVLVVASAVTGDCCGYIVMARFIAGARFMAGPMAGAAGMPFLRFLGWNVMGALVWCSLVLAIGYLLGDEVWHVIALVHRSVRWAALGVLIIALAAWLVWWWTRQTARGSDVGA